MGTQTEYRSHDPAMNWDEREVMSLLFERTMAMAWLKRTWGWAERSLVKIALVLVI